MQIADGILSHSTYKWKKVGFLSKQELECAKILLDKLIKGVNCHVRVGNKIIDFKINNVFIEFHPWDFNKLTDEQYCSQRRKVLDENGFKDNQLIILKSLEEAQHLKRIKHMAREVK